MNNGRPAWAEIDLAAIRHNVKALKTLLPNGTKLCAVVKADAYGHGAAQVGPVVLEAGADCLAVAIVDEAVQLREAGIDAPILIMGYTPPDQVADVVAHDFEQTIYTVEQAERLSAAAAASGKSVKVHLKIDTGMGRLGVRPDAAAAFAAAVAALPGIVPYGAFTHFAAADSADKKYTDGQFRLFREALSAIEAAGVSLPCRHAANSAGLLHHPDYCLDMVRAGIALYGLWPSTEIPRPVQLKPAMRLRTRVIMVKTVPRGQAISYGCTYVTPRTSRIATLPIGYADGFSRMLSGKAKVMVEGWRAPLVGTVCMDQCMVDITGIDGVREGSDVLLFGGPELPVENIANALGTINYEIVCMIGKRVPRLYVYTEAR